MRAYNGAGEEWPNAEPGVGTTRRFVELARDHASVEELALALGRELGRPALRRSLADLTELAAMVDPCDDPLERLASLCEVVANAFDPRTDGPLLLSDVLMQRGGHQDAIAVVACALADRAGLAAGLATDGEHLYLAHKGSLAVPRVADFSGTARLVDAGTLGAHLHWQCTHQTSYSTLRRVTARSERDGDLPTAIKAMELILALPLSPEARDACRMRRKQLEARFN